MFLRIFSVLSGALRPSTKPASLAVFLFFLIGFADGSMMPFFALWAHDEAGVPVAYVGFLLACYAGGELLATPAIGGIADRVGRRPVILLSTAGVGLGFLLLAFSHGAIAAAVILVFIGVCESVLHPTVSTVIADSTPAEGHRRQFARARVSSSAGRVVGPLCGALLARHGLGTVFVGSAAALLVAALITAICLPETRRPGQTQEEADGEEGLADLIPAFRDRRLAGLLLWFMLLEIVGSWVETVLPLYAHDAGTLSPSDVGLLFSYASLLIVAFQLALTRLLATRSGFGMILASGILLVGGFACLSLSAATASLIVAVTLFSFAQMLVGPLIPTTVNALAPAHARATYMAATSVASDLEDSVGPATGTALYALGVHLPWLIGIPVTALAAWGLAYQLRRHERGIPADPDLTPVQLSRGGTS